MTERVYVGTEADCRSICTLLDLIYGRPVPPSFGQYSVSPEQQTTMLATWNALTQEQRDSKAFDYVGWEMRVSELVFEFLPGIRRAVWLPGGISTVQQLLDLASQRGVTLTLQQITLLTAAVTGSLADLPANWTNPPP